MGKVVVKVAVWFVIFIILITLGLGMSSGRNTIEGVMGWFRVGTVLWLASRTKWVAGMEVERKHEK